MSDTERKLVNLFKLGRERIFPDFQDVIPATREDDTKSYIYSALPDLCDLSQNHPRSDELIHLSNTTIGRRAIQMAKIGHASDFAHLINKISHHSQGVPYGRLRVCAVRLPDDKTHQSYIFEQLSLFISYDKYALAEKRNLLRSALTFFDGRFPSEVVIKGVAGKYALMLQFISSKLSHSFFEQISEYAIPLLIPIFAKVYPTFIFAEWPSLMTIKRNLIV
jgi:hypothetical protein